MAQITGSGPGNGTNYGMVDSSYGINSLGVPQGRLWTNPSDGMSVAKGEINGTSFIHKFGDAEDFDTADGTVTIWDGADDAGVNAMMYTYSTTNDIDSLTSTDASDTQIIEIQGLGIDYEQITQEATLIGSGYVALGSPLMRVFRMKNQNSIDNAGHIYTYVSGTTTDGTPDDASGARAVMQPGNNQTLMAVYTIPSGCTGYMDKFYAGTAGAKKTTNYIIELRIRPSGGVFQLKHKSALVDTGTSRFVHPYAVPEIVPKFNDIEMRASVTEGAITQASVSAGFDLILVND